MRKHLTTRWLKTHNACPEALEAFRNQSERDSIELLTLMLRRDREKLEWANWLIVWLMSKKQCVNYAIFAAREVLSLFEKKYPKDSRPRKAIETAEAYLKNPCQKTKTASRAASRAAYDKVLRKILRQGIMILKETS